MGSMPVYIPFLIFFARICDVSIGTVRMMLVMSGRRWTASVLGFFEVTIWVLAVSGVLKYISLDNWAAVAAYGAGFAAGVYVGMLIEDKLALGYRMVRVVNPLTAASEGMGMPVLPGSAAPRPAPAAPPRRDLSSALRERGYRVTRLDGRGRGGPVEVAFTVVRRRSLPALRELIDRHAPDAFVTVERVDRTQGGSWEGRAADAGDNARAMSPASAARK